jgi:arginyl-tRNA synthetase
VYVTDAGQTTRFQTIIICVEVAGYIKEVRVDHVGFGEVVAEEDKKKFETRIGDTTVYMRRAYTRIRSIARTAKVLDKQLDEAGLQLEHEKLLLGLRDRVQLPFFHPCPVGGLYTCRGG